MIRCRQRTRCGALFGCLDFGFDHQVRLAFPAFAQPLWSVGADGSELFVINHAMLGSWVMSLGLGSRAESASMRVA